MNRDPANVVAVEFKLTYMRTCSDLEPECGDRMRYRLGTSNGGSGTIEDREQPVSGRVHVPTTVDRDLASREVVVLGHALGPSGIAQRGQVRGRPDDVGEQDSREAAIRIHGSRAPFAHERFDLGDDGLDIAEPRDPVIAGQLHQSCVGHLRGHVSSSFDRFDPIADSMQDQCRGLDDRQDLSDVTRSERSSSRPAVRAGVPFADPGTGSTVKRTNSCGLRRAGVASRGPVKRRG